MDIFSTSRNKDNEQWVFLSSLFPPECLSKNSKLPHLKAVNVVSLRCSVHGGGGAGRRGDLHSGGQAAARGPHQSGGKSCTVPGGLPFAATVNFLSFPSRLTAVGFSLPVCESGDGGEAGAPPPPLLLHGGLLLHHHLPLHLSVVHLHRPSAGHPH